MQLLPRNLTRIAVAANVANGKCLDGVTCVLITKSRSVFVARSIARSRTRFYITQQLPQCCNAFFTTTQCNIPLETCLAIFLSCSQRKTRYLKITFIASTQWHIDCETGLKKLCTVTSLIMRL